MDNERQYKIVHDLPSEQPALGFRDYAQAFSDIIEQSRPQFAIGIFGGWGSGKTTLMQAIEAQLNKDTVIPVWFSAWRYEKEEHLVVPLLDEVRESLMIWADQHRDVEDVARKTAATVGKAMRSLLAGFSFTIGVPGAMDLTLDANKQSTLLALYRYSSLGPA
jgi:predicted KAP-like P-loop ATPase